MFAADLVTAALAVGVVVLCVTTAVSTLALPTPWRHRRRRSVPGFPAIERRVVTGPPARARSPLALPPAARQAPVPTDVPSAGLREAETLVEQLLEHDPTRLADLLTHWINADDERGSATT